MDCATFYDTLASFEDVRERIAFMLNANYDFFMEDQPDAIVSYFHDITSYKEAILVARAFRSRFGTIVICREASYRTSRFVTIMDCLYGEDDFEYAYTLLTYAFEHLGFCRAQHIDSQTLVYLYCCNTVYEDSIQQMKIEYNYDMIKNENGWIFKELQEHLFHPLRIERWLKQGHDLEDYIF